MSSDRLPPVSAEVVNNSPRVEGVIFPPLASVVYPDDPTRHYGDSRHTHLQHRSSPGQSVCSNLICFTGFWHPGGIPWRDNIKNDLYKAHKHTNLPLTPSGKSAPMLPTEGAGNAHLVGSDTGEQIGACAGCVLASIPCAAVV